MQLNYDEILMSTVLQIYCCVR